MVMAMVQWEFTAECWLIGLSVPCVQARGVTQLITLYSLSTDISNNSVIPDFQVQEKECMSTFVNDFMRI